MHTSTSIVLPVCHGGSVFWPTWVTDGWNCPNQHNLVSRLSSATEEKWKYVNSSSVNWQHDIRVKIFGGVKIFLHWSVSNCNNLRRCGNTLRRAAYLWGGAGHRTHAGCRCSGQADAASCGIQSNPLGVGGAMYKCKYAAVMCPVLRLTND